MYCFALSSSYLFCVVYLLCRVDTNAGGTTCTGTVWVTVPIAIALVVVVELLSGC